MIWSGGGRVFRLARVEERAGGHTMSASAEMEFFRVRIRGVRLSEAKTVGHVSFSTETEGSNTATYENSFQVVFCVDKFYDRKAVLDVSRIAGSHARGGRGRSKEKRGGIYRCR